MAADSALGFLAQLAAMKAEGGSTAFTGSIASEDTGKKKGKKKKKKKTKKTSKESKIPKESKTKPPTRAKKGGKKQKEELPSKMGTPPTSGNKADNALGFLAQLAAMKESGGSTAYRGSFAASGKKKGKKGKKGRKKKGKKTTPATPVAIPEEDEKTPEPPATLSEIEKRKFKLKYARRKLERRKRDRENVRALKSSQNNDDSKSNAVYGKTYIDKFMKQLQTEQALVKNKITEAIKLEEQQEKNKKKQDDLLSGLGLSRDSASDRKNQNYKSLERSPGRINMLSICEEDNYQLIIPKLIKTRDKFTQTNSIMFEEYLREEFMDDFVDVEGNDISMDIKVIAGLAESTLKFGYPRELWEMESNSMSASPSPTANKIRLRQRAEEERRRKIMEEKAKRRRLREAELAKRKNISYMGRKEASVLIKQGDFLINFQKKCKWIERTLGINIEIMENVRDREDEFFEEDEEEEEKEEKKEEEKAPLHRRESVLMMKMRTQKQPKNYLKLRKTFTASILSGRAVGNISFSESNRDWFASTYFINNSSRYSMSESSGCIGIWNFMLTTYPEYLLSSENMITSTHFHPSDPFLIFGSTINGQILMWDLRSNKNKPIERSNFSNGHSSPVFTMSFLPTQKSKTKEKNVPHILSVSNDGKLCIWRTDQLSVKPVSQSILKPSDDQSTARQIELITTCFDYSYRDSTQIILGSDEGYLYKAEIFSSDGGNSQNDGSNVLSIKESINAHYGPITNVKFFKPSKRFNFGFKENITGLYLTSSYDWTVKLWHQNGKIGGNKPLSVIDQMSDYVYDVKWNIGGKPGVFACCDGDGQINLFDLTRDFKHPIITKNPIKLHPKKSNIAATTLEWTIDGKYLACGDSDGNILFYNVHKSIAQQTLESCEAFQSVANKNIV